MTNERVQLGSNGPDQQAEVERTISSAEQLLKSAAADIDDCVAGKLAEKLILIFDAPYHVNSDLRHRASHLVSELASRNIAALNLLIQNAKRYDLNEQIEDADPYSPNAFEVLGEVHRSDDVTIRFLADVARSETGIARHEAIEALNALEDPRAAEILGNISCRLNVLGNLEHRSNA